MRRILELTAKIEADPSRASQLLNRFVKRHQFPLIEGDNATFFFWDGRPAESVYLQHWVFGLPSHQPYRRIDGTDAFYLPLELPHKARIEYKIEVERGGRRQWTRDPLNPRRAFDPFGSNSVCPMPGYQDPPWVRPDPAVRHGRMRSFSFHSEVFGDQRDIEVYLPAEFRPHKRYPLLICHDGRDYQRFTDMRTTSSAGTRWPRSSSPSRAGCSATSSTGRTRFRHDFWSKNSCLHWSLATRSSPAPRRAA